jgi:hypothetical protein
MADTYAKLLGLSDAPPSPSDSGRAIPEQSTIAKVQTGDAKKSTKPQTHIPLHQSSDFESVEKLEKYTTHLEPSLIKKLKLHATERDMKDYQVVRNALLLYFEKNK